MATANTFVQIGSTVTVSTAVATISFTSIPATYTDLVLKVSLRTDRSNTNDSCSIYFNSDTTAANYSFKTLYGDGTSAASNSGSTYIGALAYISAASATANTFGNTEFYIPNYAGSTQKSVSVDSVGENNATANLYNLGGYAWTGTAAITGITIVTANGPNFVQYSTASLYGILKY